ncbi:class A basic helix-loop-helix protein 9-like [Conger conger]|uniref:class A basic helix-loop-helix protein 9-like n=1 Tax=Conger conger TaxID=82655 RepID=UPI002A5ADD50|nr:class A basic helix-loop-helix protein 9-like [Conger conger]
MSRRSSSMTESELSDEEAEAPGLELEDSSSDGGKESPPHAGEGLSEGSPGGARDPGAGKRRSRPARSKARRVAANVRERKRILDYNQAFNALRSALRHDLSGKRLSKIATLRRAINRISSLSVFLRAHPPPLCAPLEGRGQPDAPGPRAETESGFPGLAEGYLLRHPPAAHPHPHSSMPREPPLYPADPSGPPGAPPSPHYAHFPADAQLFAPHERYPGPRDELHSPPLYAVGCGGGAGYQFGVRASCHQNHMDTFADGHPTLPLSWQLGYIQGGGGFLQGGSGFQQSLSMH